MGGRGGGRELRGVGTEGRGRISWDQTRMLLFVFVVIFVVCVGVVHVVVYFVLVSPDRAVQYEVLPSIFCIAVFLVLEMLAVVVVMVVLLPLSRLLTNTVGNGPKWG